MDNFHEGPRFMDASFERWFNNFFCYLPGGKYRLIDTQLLFSEVTRGNEKIWGAIERAKKEGFTSELRKINDEREAIKQKADKKLAPLFDAMVKLGYTENELMT